MCVWYIARNAVEFVRETEEDVYFFYSNLVTASKTCAYTQKKTPEKSFLYDKY